MRNSKLEERRKKISQDIDIFVNASFDIVDRIHNILKAQGEEQKSLAIALGKSESEISKWMTGTHNFTLKSISKIEAALGQPIINVIGSEIEATKLVYIYTPYIVYKDKPGRKSTTSILEGCLWGQPVSQELTEFLS